jgi:hypothetical protein
VRAVSKETDNRRRGCFGASVLGRSHPARGVVRSLESRNRRLRPKGMCSSPRARAGRGPGAWKENALEGHKPKRVSASWSGETWASCERTRRRDQGFEAGEAGGTRRFRGKSPGVTGKRASVREKGAHSRWREPCDCVKAWELGKPAVTRTRVVRLSTPVDNCRKACGLREGCTISCEGNALKGGTNPRNGCGMKQSREARAC